MIYERLPDYFSKEETEQIIQQKKEIISKASRIIAISKNTKKDLVELLHIDQQKIDVIYHGTSMQRFENKITMQLPEKYILFVGSRYSYKNFNRFIEACNHTIFRHDNFIGCLSADKIKMPVRKYFCFNIPVYRNMAEAPSCRSPYHEEYIQTSVSGNSEGLCRSTYSFLSERR